MTERIPRHAPPVRSKAYQRDIREYHQVFLPRSALATTEGCRVEAITKTEAEHIILNYEWLGTMGSSSVAFYGMRSPGDELLGVAVFGWPGSVHSRDICGRDYRELAICLERGACVHYAPRNAASFLISRATAQAARDHGWHIFYAYADVAAGEIGTVYQACSWLYIGQGVGRSHSKGDHVLRQDWFIPEENKTISSRTMRNRGITPRQAYDELGWQPVSRYPKHKYVRFECGRIERNRLMKALRYPVLPYPKREG